MKKEKIIVLCTCHELSSPLHCPPRESTGTSCDLLPFGSIPLPAIFLFTETFSIFVIGGLRNGKRIRNGIQNTKEKHLTFHLNGNEHVLGVSGNMFSTHFWIILTFPTSLRNGFSMKAPNFTPLLKLKQILSIKCLTQKP